MTLGILIVLYVLVLGYLGWLGYKHTKTSADYLVAGRNVHPFIMAMSYGATFISTSAIVGFGGVAANIGLSLMWLTFLNIFVGIFIAFVFLGNRTRKMAHKLDAHTFAELLGRRYRSNFIQVFVGVLILTMTIYTAVVLIGAGRYLEKTLNVDFNVALIIFGLIILVYVISGGLKAVMYTDALQGSLMFIGMVMLLIFTVIQLGGLFKAHDELGKLYDKVINRDIKGYVIELGNREGIKISDKEAEEIVGEINKIMKEVKGINNKDEKEKVIRDRLYDIEYVHKDKVMLKKVFDIYKDVSLQIMQKEVLEGLKGKGHRGWVSMPEGGSPLWWLIVTTIILGVGIGVLAQPQLAVRFMTVKSKKEINRSVLVGGIFIFVMVGITYMIGGLSNVWFYDKMGVISIVAGEMNVDKIIPTFLNMATPSWFNYIFMLSLLSAAMSTLSSQFHTMGTAISRDIFERLLGKRLDSNKVIVVNKIGIGVMFVITLVLGYVLPEGYIAAGTAIFFGLCASTFLPSYIGGLYWRRGSKAGAIASMISGSVISIFWLLFVHVFTISKWGGKSIIGGTWSMVDPLLIGLPISTIVYIVVSLFTAKSERSS
ncbi:MAG TPA: sodium:solute symporter family protein [Spirochaetota bacterium]|nr:sodium:solute symporter family protein [Spirochaetota bacterium]